MVPPAPILRAAVPSDAAGLASFGARSFVATYGDDNPPGLVEAHAREIFGHAQQAAEIADPTVHHVVAEQDGALVGYAMVADRPAPEAVVARSPLQLVRLYVDGPVKGRGVGTALVAEALGSAQDLGHDVVWLTVWSRNPRAIAAYERWGFVDVGSTIFDMAGDPQVDRLMVRHTTGGGPGGGSCPNPR